MLKLDFAFSNVESICVFTSIFVAIRSATSYNFEFTSRIKRPLLEIFKLIVTTFRNQDKKVVFVRVYEYGELARSSEFMNICHNMNIIVQTTCGDACYFNGKSESHNKKFIILQELLY